LKYGYDHLGQVTNGWRYWADGGNMLGQTFNSTISAIARPPEQEVML